MKNLFNFKGRSDSKDKKSIEFMSINPDNSNLNYYDFRSSITLEPENKTRTLDYSMPFKNGEINHNTISYGSGLIISENNNNFLSISRNNSLKNEIENLDMEIKILQKKLKVMIIDKKK